MSPLENENKAYLLLEDGTFFVGKAAGKIGTATGEICFNTGMTGYQEVFTDPSYYGQVLLTTNAHIGNYGTAEKDNESEQVQISGLICKNFTNKYSRSMADDAIEDYFQKNNLTCIYGVDTRMLVRHVRNKGAMNCIISSEILDKEGLKSKLAEVPSMEGLELASKVSTKEAYNLGDEKSDLRISVLDFGTKRNILNCMVERGAYLKVYPAQTKHADLLDFNPDAFFLSNGPGDPGSMDYAVDTVKELLKLEKPMFGICLGHQILARALDVPTYKMHHGHRGINHPVKNLLTGTCEITTQNHGFGVDPEVVRAKSAEVEITHVNLNDDTIEGIRTTNNKAFSVQYHPEANPGPHDSRYLFDDFITAIKKDKK
jgi:carbamoyl-phosphate synthase small subunit